MECSALTASSFRIWNSSTGIPSPPLALFLVMLPKAHLTSHSRMSSYRWMWVITPSWLSGSWRSFCTVLLCILATSSISSASVRSIPLLSFIEPIFAWNVPLESLNFLEEISSFFPFIFLYFFVLITEEVFFLISPWYSFELCIQICYLSFSPLLFTSLLFTAICKASPDSHFAFLHFFFLWMDLIPVSCTMSQTSVHSSSGTLSDLVP